MYSTDIELTNTQAQATSHAALLPGEDADLSLAAESLARRMEQEAQRYTQHMRSLDALLHSVKVRRRTAWQRSRKIR